MGARFDQIALALAVLLTTAAGSEAAWACQCDADGMPVRDAFGWVDAVFEGTVVDIRTEKATTGREGVASWTWSRLRVGRAWKGVESGAEVLVGSGPDGSDCPDYAFSTGARYLVYAHRGRYPFASLVAIVCTRTRPLDRADADIRELEAMAKSARPSRAAPATRGCAGCALEASGGSAGSSGAAASALLVLCARRVLRRRRSAALRGRVRAATVPRRRRSTWPAGSPAFATVGRSRSSPPRR